MKVFGVPIKVFRGIFHLLVSSPPDPLASPPLVLLAALVTSLLCFDVPGLGDPARFLSLSPGCGVRRLLLLPVDVGRDVEMSVSCNNCLPRLEFSGSLEKLSFVQSI